MIIYIFFLGIENLQNTKKVTFKNLKYLILFRYSHTLLLMGTHFILLAQTVSLIFNKSYKNFRNTIILVAY